MGGTAAVALSSAVTYDAVMHFESPIHRLVNSSIDPPAVLMY